MDAFRAQLDVPPFKSKCGRAISKQKYDRQEYQTFFEMLEQHSRVRRTSNFPATMPSLDRVNPQAQKHTEGHSFQYGQVNYADIRVHIGHTKKFHSRRRHVFVARSQMFKYHKRGLVSKPVILICQEPGCDT